MLLNIRNLYTSIPQSNIANFKVQILTQDTIIICQVHTLKFRKSLHYCVELVITYIICNH